MSVQSLAELRDRNMRDDLLDLAGHVARSALAGSLAALPVALVLVGVLMLAPTVTVGSVELVLLTLVACWSILALFGAALASARPR